MSNVPSGWYADPAPGELAGASERYWDGFSWTHQVRPAQSAHAPNDGSPYPDAVYEETPIPSTPDGQVLAGWWIRAGALLLDWVIVAPLLVLVALPSLVSHWDSIAAWWNDGYGPNGTLRTTGGMANPPVLDPHTRPGFVLFSCLFVTGVVYAVVFLRWKQATPGKLVAGLRVRRRSAPGPLGWSTILRRVGFVAALRFGVWLPVVGIAFVLLAALDYLWPLWDANRQALHDKVAGTNVVLTRVEPSGTPPAPPPAESDFRPLASTDLTGDVRDHDGG